ncbi:unnamed protein product [Orchesella dallaii]|uniref:Uncharacterized protein n=1 Tax=Orchesella dallaii TaxID=48710 RepID=A0ABP1R0A0_9HEXA
MAHQPEVEVVGAIGGTTPIFNVKLEYLRGTPLPSIEDNDEWNAATKKQIMRGKRNFTEDDMVRGTTPFIFRLGNNFYATSHDTGVMGTFLPLPPPQRGFKLCVLRFN